MKAPLSWIKTFLKINTPIDTIANTLTMAGLEVDHIEHTKCTFSGVKSAILKTVKKHPHADKLFVTEVFDGENTLQIVCGDPSCANAIGNHVALASVGATLTDAKGKTFKIKQASLREVDSYGMLCSEKELGLSDHDSTILYLDSHILPGTSLSQLFEDTIFDISLTPNLGHCMSLLGISRELSAHLNAPLLPTPSYITQPSTPLQLKITTTNECLRYCVQKIENVSIKPSPKWLQSRLEQVGIRSINSIVDVTNYVMIEMGIPLHAFDQNLIKGNSLSISLADKETVFTALNEQSYTIPPGTLMIYDEQKPIAIAGIMGGANTAVSESTQTILLEAACFDPKTIRKGSKHLNLRTDASARFEKGVDCSMVPQALQRAVSLIKDIESGSPSTHYIDHMPHPQPSRKVNLRVNKTNHLLGTHLSSHEIADILKKIDCTFTLKNDQFTVSIPSYRNDINEEIDLIEEVARLFGYNNISRSSQAVHPSLLNHSASYTNTQWVREQCIRAGLIEWITCDLISPQLNALCLEASLGDKESLKVLKPSSVDQSLLRMSLLPGMIHSAIHNFDHKIFNLRSFEIGNIHFKTPQGYQERLTLGLLLAGQRSPSYWENPSCAVDFFDLKGCVQTLAPNSMYQPSHLHSFHPQKQARILIKDTQIGVCGQVHPKNILEHNITIPIFYCQIDLMTWIHHYPPLTTFTSLPQFPSTTRDWTLSIKKEASLRPLFDAIDTHRIPLIKTYSLIDIYHHDSQQNITLRFVYSSDKKTLKNHQVEKIHTRFINSISKAIETLSI